MIFNNPPKFSGISSQLIRFIQNDLYTWCQNISTGLRKLDFLQNFEQFNATEIEIPYTGVLADDTVRIPNGFKKSTTGGAVPRGRVIIYQSGNGLVTDGNWTVDFVELINNGPDPVIISVIFFK